MRLSHFKIRNYRGIRFAEASELEKQQLILITGKNGTGKSLILEALTALWTANINLPEFVGPYGHSLEIEVGVQFEPEEYDQVDAWRRNREMPDAERKETHILSAVSTNSEESGRYLDHEDSMLETVQNELFSKEHPFTSIDLLSARRQVSMTTSSSVDLDLLDKTASAQSRREMYEQEIRWKSAMQMPDIGAYLMSLDYRDFVSSRALQKTNSAHNGSATEYSKLQRIFFEATGKLISLPQYDNVTTKSSIKVELPSKKTHSLEDLSNGEREMLGMLYYISQLSAQGGVLLLDEPEKHLHPTLQLAVLRAMASISDRGQIFVVTHSPGIIAATPSKDVFTVRSAWETEENQVERVSTLAEQADLLSDLGITQKDLFQANFLLVLEGPNDEKRLQMLLPDELAAAKVVIAGGREAALRTASALNNLNLRVPWICVVDRDFLTNNELAALTIKKEVFVWDARMIECAIITKDLLYKIFEFANISEGEIDTKFASILENLKEYSFGQFIQHRIKKVYHKTSPLENSGPKLDNIQKSLLKDIEYFTFINNNYKDLRKAIIDELDSDWPKNWRYIIEGKRLISELQKEIKFYHNKEVMMDALMLSIRHNLDIAPPDIIRLRNNINETIRAHAKLYTDEENFEHSDKKISDLVKTLPHTPELNIDDDQVRYGC